jgi:hypothetical protein
MAIRDLSAPAMPYAGMPEHLFHLHGVEYYGRSPAQGGLLCADAMRRSVPLRRGEPGSGRVSTAFSRARPVLRDQRRGSRLRNETDPPAARTRFRARGKSRCKEALLRVRVRRRHRGAAVRDDLPLADRRADLIAAALPRLVERPALLSSGAATATAGTCPAWPAPIPALRDPHRHDEPAHLIGAGADCLMPRPSRAV